MKHLWMTCYLSYETTHVKVYLCIYIQQIKTNKRQNYKEKCFVLNEVIRCNFDYELLALALACVVLFSPPDLDDDFVSPCDAGILPPSDFFGNNIC